MKERPIIFSGEMVRAILAGRKTQTRRIIKGKCPEDENDNPYGKPGDRLWVRESLRGDGNPGGRRKGIMRYAADGEMVMVDGADVVWQFKKPVVPSIHMPRWASRITLEVVRVRVERLQDISPADCMAEGIKVFAGEKLIFPGTSKMDNAIYIDQYVKLWNSINAKRGYGWKENPYVWIIEFKRVEG